MCAVHLSPNARTHGKCPARPRDGSRRRTTLANAGDEIISTTSLYGGTYNLFHYTLPKWGITVRFVDAEDEAGLRAAVNDKTRAIYTETVGNPKLDIVDIEKLAAIAHENGLPLMIDNTTPSPALIRPIEYGADIVLQSLTKFIGGHGTSIGGAIIDAGKFDWKASGRFADFTNPDPSYHGLVYTDAFGPLAFILKARVQGLRDTGGCLSPFNAFLILQGAETLHLRMERHSENALTVAKFLQGKEPRGMIGIREVVRCCLIDRDGARIRGWVGGLATVNGQGFQLIIWFRHG